MDPMNQAQSGWIGPGLDTTSVKPRPPLRAALDSLEQSIVQNEGASAALREHLDPIMGAGEPTPPHDNTLAQVQPPHSSLVQNVIALAERIDASTALLRSIEQRLEL